MQPSKWLIQRQMQARCTQTDAGNDKTRRPKMASVKNYRIAGNQFLSPGIMDLGESHIFHWWLTQYGKYILPSSATNSSTPQWVSRVVLVLVSLNSMGYWILRRPKMNNRGWFYKKIFHLRLEPTDNNKYVKQTSSWRHIEMQSLQRNIGNFY